MCNSTPNELLTTIFLDQIEKYSQKILCTSLCSIIWYICLRTKCSNFRAKMGGKMLIRNNDPRHGAGVTVPQAVFTGVSFLCNTHGHIRHVHQIWSDSSSVNCNVISFNKFYELLEFFFACIDSNWNVLVDDFGRGLWNTMNLRYLTKFLLYGLLARGDTYY